MYPLFKTYEESAERAGVGKQNFVSLLAVIFISSCVTTGGDPDMDNPTLTQPVYSSDYPDSARDAGNGLFGNIEAPTRIPTDREMSAALEPGIGCENCADNAINIERGNFGRDPGYTVSLKNYRNPSHGCTPYTAVSSAEADRLLASQNLSVRAAPGAREVSDQEKRSVGAAIKRVQELNGGVLSTGTHPTHNPYPFIFHDDNGSGQRADHIKIGRNPGRGHDHYGNSVAQHVHEWSHLIGNNGAYTRFKRYMDQNSYGTNDYCLVSNYADDNHNEQFAEVFTAFVTEPAILLNNSRTPEACRKAFRFFQEEFFNRGNRVENCIPHPLANR